MISISKLYDTALGSNNAILFNSDYYRMVLVLGVILVVLTVVLNMIFIPWLGIDGAGLATFLAVFAYNTIKLFFVYRKFKIFPFTQYTLKISVLILCCVLLFYFWDFPFHPFVNIGLKSVLITLLYTFIVYRFNYSDDISNQIKKYLSFK
jgi:O-antigen/teichoic acid export membrane protein